MRSLRLGRHRTMDFVPQHDHVFFCGDFNERTRWRANSRLGSTDASAYAATNPLELACGTLSERRELVKQAAAMAAVLESTVTSRSRSKADVIAALKEVGFDEGDIAAFKPTCVVLPCVASI